MRSESTGAAHGAARLVLAEADKAAKARAARDGGAPKPKPVAVRRESEGE